MHVLLTGGTGLIGSYLVPALRKAGHTATLLSRKARHSDDEGVRYVEWDGRSIPVDLPHVDAVINLAGAGVADHRWTASYKQIILNSRINATAACVAFIKQQATPPRVFLSGSAVGYYGTDGGHSTRVFTESDPPGKDFLGHVGKQWEAAAAGAGIRTVILRTGVVLAPDGGAFPKLLAPFKLYAGGHIASGKQGFPWIHIADEVGAILHLLEDESASGPFNLVAPELHTNGSFGKAVGEVMHRPAGLPVPAFAVKLMLGESAVIVTEGQQVSADKLLELGYAFQYPTAKPAIEQLLAAST